MLIFENVARGMCMLSSGLLFDLWSFNYDDIAECFWLGESVDV